MIVSPTQIVAQYISDTTFTDFPPDVILMAKRCILDSIGCAFGGSVTKFGRLDIDALKDVGQATGATIMGDGARLSTPMAAFLNTSLTHMMDYDDTSTFPGGHPGASIIQSALAAAETVRATGKELLAATIVGYEVALRIGEATRPSPDRLREGPVGGWITFGPAAATAKILGLNEEQCRSTLGLVASSLEGSAKAPGARHGVRWISDKRPGLYKIGSGLKALWGVVSALRAQKGFPAPESALEGIFWTALGTDQCNHEKITEGLGMEYRIMGMAFKPYPCCRYLHVVLDGVKALFHQHNFDLQDVERMVVEGYQTLAPLATISKPKDMWEAQFSLPYTVALVVTNEKPGLSWFNPDLFADPFLFTIGQKVEYVEDPNASRQWFEEKKQVCQVTITTQDGTKEQITVENAHGNPEKPLTDEELREKFLDLAIEAVGVEKGLQIISIIDKLEDIADLSPLAECFSG